MPLNFPSTPVLNQVITIDNLSWFWNGRAWQHVADTMTLGASIAISDLSPTNPSAGDLWWDSGSGSLRLYYTDGDSSQWVDAINVEGPQGIQGATGIQGNVGATGATGIQGDIGITGATGPVGADSTVAGPIGPGVPIGGTTGQILAKLSNTDYATQWSTPFLGQYQVISTEYVSGTGTFTPNAQAKFFQVICTAGGGGGGGADSDGSAGAISGGGGGGGTAIRWYSLTEMGVSAAYVVGAGGTAGDGATGGTGGTGGTSSFNPEGTGTTMISSGGTGGTGTGAAYAAVAGAFLGGTGNTGNGGHININGGHGEPGWTTGVVSVMPKGGSSFYGDGAKGQVFPTPVNGVGAGGLRPGSGGGGSASMTLTTGVAGTTGAPGLIVILQYI